MKLRWIIGGLWTAGWLAFGLHAHYSNREPTDWNVEFYHVSEPSEWHNEDSHPICCANETEECRRCVTVM